MLLEMTRNNSNKNMSVSIVYLSPFTQNTTEVTELLLKILNELTQVQRQTSSCIDLIFTGVPNLLVKSGVYPSLMTICYHQIVQSKFDLNFFYRSSY